MAIQGCGQASFGGIPDPDRAIHATRGQERTIGVECYRQDCAAMAEQWFAMRFSGSGVPQSHRSIRAPRSEQSTIWAVCYGQNLTTVPKELPDFFPRPYVPNSNRTIVGRRCEKLPTRMDYHARKEANMNRQHDCLI